MSRMIFDVGGDDAPPAPGTILAPAEGDGARAWYEVMTVEPVESRVHLNRWRLEVRRIRTSDPADWPLGTPIVRYVRNRRRP